MLATHKMLVVRAATEILIPCVWHSLSISGDVWPSVTSIVARYAEMWKRARIYAYDTGKILGQKP